MTTPLARALRTVRANIVPFSAAYPGDCTVAGSYQVRALPGHANGANVGWTTGFWPGMLWLAYELEGDEAYKTAGLRELERFAVRIDGLSDVETHDLGFLYTLSAAAPWRNVPEMRAEARRVALAAADHLMTRFLEPVGIIQAWGNLGDPSQCGRTIIDSLMNLPLLRWASGVTGDRRY
ncbi:MAG: glycoside hydrolase family 88 protein, partial [Propionibacteriaceae bacterium]|nr:glycoside hydrolase family 88 protein [Propionibacteriaceae bacterium]